MFGTQRADGNPFDPIKQQFNQIILTLKQQRPEPAAHTHPFPTKMQLESLKPQSHSEKLGLLSSMCEFSGLCFVKEDDFTIAIGGNQLLVDLSFSPSDLLVLGGRQSLEIGCNINFATSTPFCDEAFLFLVRKRFRDCWRLGDFYSLVQVVQFLAHMDKNEKEPSFGVLGLFNSLREAGFTAAELGPSAQVESIAFGWGCISFRGGSSLSISYYAPLGDLFSAGLYPDTAGAGSLEVLDCDFLSQCTLKFSKARWIVEFTSKLFSPEVVESETLEGAVETIKARKMQLIAKEIKRSADPQSVGPAEDAFNFTWEGRFQVSIKSPTDIGVLENGSPMPSASKALCLSRDLNIAASYSS